MSELVGHVAAQLGVGWTAGDNVIGLEFKPTTPDRAVCVKPYMAEPSLMAFGPAGGTNHGDRIRFQVVSRARTGAEAEAVAYAVHAFLMKMHEATLGTVRYLGIEAVTGPPLPMREDENGRWEWSCNYLATREWAA